MDRMSAEWQNVSSSGTRLFDSSLREIESIIQLIQQAQECVSGTGDDTHANTNDSSTGLNPTGTNLNIRGVVQSLQTKCGDAKNKANKEFKAFQTSLAKVTTQLEKSYAPADLDSLCKNKLRAVHDSGNITQPNEQVASENNPPTSISTMLNEAASEQSSVDDTNADLLTSSFDAILIESWLRDGRVELAQSLRTESRAEADPNVTTSHAIATSSSSPSPSTSVPTTQITSANANSIIHSSTLFLQSHQFMQMNLMLEDLKRRDIDSTLNWLVRQKASIDVEIGRVEAFMQSIRFPRQQQTLASAYNDTTIDGISQSPIVASTSFSTHATTVRRRRVNFRDGDGNILFSPSQLISPPTQQQQQQTQQQQHPDQDLEKSPQSTSSMLSSLRSHVSSFREYRSSLHRLHFDIHRLRFLQLLMESEREGKVRRSQAVGTEYSHKRKKRKGSFIRNGDEDDRSRKHGSSVDHSDAAATTRAQGDSSDSDDELNRIAENAQNGSSPSVGGAPHPSSFSYQSALQYAQSFFPLFADTRMEDIGRLSGCLLFLGRLTEGKEEEEESEEDAVPSSPVSNSHPYRPYFTRSGQSSMWNDVYHRASSLCLIQLNRCAMDPFDACLQACDIALPQLSRFESILKLNRDIMASAESTVTDIDLGVRFQFHSTFICPVTKEQCTNAISEEEQQQRQQQAGSYASPQPSSTLQSLLTTIYSPLPSIIDGNNPASAPSESTVGNNPPVMLTCGHVISLSAMERIVKGLRATRRFKCPTCPREQTPNEVLVLVL